MTSPVDAKEAARLKRAATAKAWYKIHGARVRAEERERRKDPEYARAKREKHNEYCRTVWNPKNGVVKTAKQNIKRVADKYPDAFKYDGSENVEQFELWIYAMRDKPCPYCGDKTEHVDHIQPLTLGGEHSWSNMRMLCKMCNMGKAAYPEAQFFDWIKRIAKHQGI